MLRYFISVFSLKKLSPSISPLAYWDKSSSFQKTSQIRRFAKLKNSHVGKYSRVNPYCKFSNVEVGNFTAIGQATEIGLGRHPLHYISTHSIFYKKNKISNRWVKPIDLEALPVKIGNDVWIGIQSLIFDGVTVGDGAVVGARSVVTKDVPPYAIVVGSPARIVRYRFDEDVIERLLGLQWWHWPEDKITENIELFRNPAITLEALKNYTY